MTMSINSGYTNSYSASTTAVNKINGRQQTVMTANFADMLNANMATSAKSATTATTSTDKVTLSTQATQTTAQDDIEAEAQKLFNQTMNSSMWKQGIIPLSWGSGDLTSNNQQLMSSLKKDHDSMFGSPAMNTEKFKNTNLMIATLGAFGSKQEFNSDTLKRQSQVYEKYWDLMKEELGDKAVLPY